MRPSRRWPLCLLIVLCLFAVAASAQSDLPNLKTVTNQPDGGATTTGKGDATTKGGDTTKTDAPKKTDDAKTTDDPKKTDESKTEDAKTTAAPESSTKASNKVTDAPPLSTQSPSKASASETSSSTFEGITLSDLPTIAGVGVPKVGVPDTSRAPFMQKSNLPDGTVFICVGAALGFFGAAILAWRGLVAWSLHRSVKRAAMAQNLADLKAMSATPGKKRGFYSAVGATSTMSLDRLSAAPTGTSRPPKPFASGNNGSTPPRHSSQANLFFSPTAGGTPGLHNPQNRSSNYLPAGYYAAGSAQPAAGSPMTHVGGAASTLSVNAPTNRFSSRGISPPASPSLPPSRGPGASYDRAPPSRGNESLRDRNSIATLSQQRPYSAFNGASQSNLSLNVSGGASAVGGRAPSAYLEDLFENHGSGSRERF